MEVWRVCYSDTTSSSGSRGSWGINTVQPWFSSMSATTTSKLPSGDWWALFSVHEKKKLLDRRELNRIHSHLRLTNKVKVHHLVTVIMNTMWLWISDSSKSGWEKKPSKLFEGAFSTEQRIKQTNTAHAKKNTAFLQWYHEFTIIKWRTA